MFELSKCDCSIPSPVSGVISLFEGSNIGDSTRRRPSVFPEGVLGKMSSVESELGLDLAIKSQCIQIVHRWLGQSYSLSKMMIGR